MNKQEKQDWEARARDFLGDRRMLKAYCLPGTQVIYMDLGHRMTGEAKHVYFLKHRDELPALHNMEVKYHHCHACLFSSNWLKGLRMLLAMRLGYQDPVYNDCFGKLFDFEEIGFGREPEYNPTFMDIGGRYYHLNALKEEQLDALLHSDLAQLRLFVDLAPVPGRKLRQLIFLAIRNKQYHDASEMMGWVPEYKNSIDSETFAMLVKNVYLLGQTQNGFLKKLQNLDEDPVIKTIVDSGEFRSKWFSWLMAAKLLNYSIMKQLLKMGFPKNIPLNPKSYTNKDDGFDKRRYPSPSVIQIMLAFHDVKPFVEPPLTEYLAENKDDDTYSYRLYKDILLYCRLADAFCEQES